VPNPPHSAGASAGPFPEVLSDLATLLTDDAAIYICLEPLGAVMSVKSPEMVAFGRSLIADWVRLSPEERARKLVEWIQQAASYCQNPRLRWAPPDVGENSGKYRRSSSA
jgi:hypothetical protein